MARVVVAFLFLSMTNAASALTVCADCQTRSIAAAVKLAPAGTTITVKGGTYHEHDLVIDKPLKIVAAANEHPVLDAGGVGNGFIVRAANVEISGFVIRDSGLSYTSELAAIRVDEASSCTIKNNTVEGAHFGIYLARAKGCAIEGNKVTGADRAENLAGNCIHIWSGQDMRIERNTLRRCRDGIYFEFVSGSRITGNQSLDNRRYGLHFMFSSDNIYRGNVFTDNESGVAVMYSKRIRMLDNVFSGSLGPAAYGILLKDITDSDIRANRFADNTVALYVEGTTRSVFTGNNFEHNGWAMRILGDSDGNSIVQNNFIANTLDIATNATINSNQFSNNYWNRYKGFDLDHNGIGDDPYHPVQLTSMLMEKYGASVLLINSFFFTLLDQVESVMPVLTPKAFVDPAPLMKKVGGQ